MRYFITFAYDGTGYHGSQIQPNGCTIQAEMELALATILREPVGLVFAGRTDAGVHAEMMVAHFDLDKLPPANLAARLNNLLPRSIAVKDIRQVGELAHARFDALERTYCYRITNHKDPFSCLYRARIGQRLNFAAMNEAAEYLIGKQDFSSFCRAHTDSKTTICDVREARWVRESETDAYFIIRADRFLRNMVRAIVGTLFEVGIGKMTTDEFADVIDAHNRCHAGHSAPAEGLALVEIIYSNNLYI